MRRKETPAAQHLRFVEVAKKLEASEAPEDFDRAFKRIIVDRPQRTATHKSRGQNR